MDKLGFDIEPLDISELQDQSSEAEGQSEDEYVSKPHTAHTGESDHPDESSKRHSSLESSSSSSSSVPKELRQEDAVFVKIKLPNGHVITLTAFPRMTINQLKIELSRKLQVPEDIIQFWDNIIKPNVLENEDAELGSLQITKSNLDLFAFSTDPEINLATVFQREPNSSIDIITVTLEQPNVSPKQIVVEVINQAQRKFLGGFRCRKTNKEFLHAETQTENFKVNKEKVDKIKRSRTCQTVNINHIIQQTSMNKEVQTVDISTDHNNEGILITPSSSSSPNGDRDLTNITSKVITIQRIWRRWKARQRFQKIKKEYTEKVLSEIDAPYLKGPYNPAVFEVLYQLVERWRAKCIDHAYSTKTEGPTRADFQDILEMQVNLLAVIEKERVKMRKKLKEEKERKLLKKSCLPVTWKGYKGMTISMETIQSQRAAELKKLYDLLGQGHESIEKMKENLSTVQAALKCQKNTKCNEILTLLSREMQLLEMGFGSKEIESLHRRIEKLFASYIREPTNFKAPKKDQFYLCAQCKKMLPPTSFVIPLGEARIKLCVSCHWIDNISHKRINYNPYQVILRELRGDEMRRGCYKSLAFIMEVHDICYLIDQIWHCQSAISQISDLSELRLCRWDRREDWAPWNTIILTRTEVKDHAQIANLESVYGQNFIKNIKVKLLMAQMHFKTLYNIKMD